MDKKGKIKIAICIVLLLAFMIGIYLYVTPHEALPDFLNSDSTNTELSHSQLDNKYKPDQKTIIYYPADFNENIYNDDAYVDLISSYALEYVDGDINYKLKYDDLEKIGGNLSIFFYNYFNDIRNGDNEKYNSYFDERAFKIREKAGEFTMQQIYDIVIKPLNIDPDLGEEYDWVKDSGIEPIYVDVSYKIRKNNGTFRLGVNSDTSKPQLYILYDSGKEYKIINIVDYTPIYL